MRSQEEEMRSQEEEVRRMMRLVLENPEASNDLLVNKYSSLFPQSGLVKSELVEMVEYIRDQKKRDLSRSVEDEMESLNVTVNTSTTL